LEIGCLIGHAYFSYFVGFFSFFMSDSVACIAFYFRTNFILENDCNAVCVQAQNRDRPKKKKTCVLSTSASLYEILINTV